MASRTLVVAGSCGGPRVTRKSWLLLVVLDSGQSKVSKFRFAVTEHNARAQQKSKLTQNLSRITVSQWLLSQWNAKLEGFVGRVRRPCLTYSFQAPQGRAYHLTRW
jgi:hypothetical protein